MGGIGEGRNALYEMYPPMKCNGECCDSDRFIHTKTDATKITALMPCKARCRWWAYLKHCKCQYANAIQNVLSMVKVKCCQSLLSIPVNVHVRMVIKTINAIFVGSHGIHKTSTNGMIRSSEETDQALQCVDGTVVQQRQSLVRSGSIRATKRPRDSGNFG